MYFIGYLLFALSAYALPAVNTTVATDTTAAVTTASPAAQNTTTTEGPTTTPSPARVLNFEFSKNSDF